MADLKMRKKGKSKSNNYINENNFKSTKFSASGSAAVIKSTSRTINPKNETFSKKQSSTVPGSILDKLDLDNLKETALKKMKTGLNPACPMSRDACIEYTLDMVINNLISNGHLDPGKAQKMRSPVMQAKIAAICEDMISAKQEICNARIAKYFRGRKKASKSLSKKRSRSKEKGQKWVIQPASLPITIVTNRSLTKLSKFTTIEKMNLAIKHTTEGIKSFPNVSTDTPNKQKSCKKPRAKSLESSTERKQEPKPQRSVSPKASTERKQEPKRQRSVSPKASTERNQEPKLPVSPKPSSEKKKVYQQQASSEVPSSNHSLENNLKMLSSSSNLTERSSSKVKVSQQIEPVQTSESHKQVEDGDTNVASPSPPCATLSAKTDDIKSNDDKQDVLVEAPVQSLPQILNLNKSKTRIFTPTPLVTPAAKSSPSAIMSPNTLNAIIKSSNCSLLSTASTGYNCLVDLKGFQNDEISMEVEGRQLVFLASRAKRNDLNMRKVTEIVEVPQKVNMENLKIGRRIDGYVIIEEHDTL